ncbi:MAG: sterol desaturase family protein [Rhodothermaceae bacterium]|nr:sterol desaturase family protein [Rhodothermaceae bacterium]
MKEIKHEGSGKIFESSALEVLTRAYPLVSVGVYLTIIAGLLFVGIQRGVVDSFLTGAAIFVGAFFFWTLFEYLFHRFINHLDSFFPESEAIRKFDYAIHGIHHEFPRDTDRLIMPPVPGTIIISILFVLFWIPLQGYIFIFMPGFLLGYLTYAFIHYATHAYKPPKAKWLKVLWKHHAIHHYKHPDKAFGVSTPVWDYVFRTMPEDKKKEVEAVETTA